MWAFLQRESWISPKIDNFIPSFQAYFSCLMQAIAYWIWAELSFIHTIFSLWPFILRNDCFMTEFRSFKSKQLAPASILRSRSAHILKQCIKELNSSKKIKLLLCGGKSEANQIEASLWEDIVQWERTTSDLKLKKIEEERKRACLFHEILTHLPSKGPKQKWNLSLTERKQSCWISGTPRRWLWQIVTLIRGKRKVENYGLSKSFSPHAGSNQSGDNNSSSPDQTWK